MTVPYALAALVAIVVQNDVRAQAEPSPVEESATADTGFGEVEEIIVRGRGLGELRFEIRRSEEAVFARFNEINSTDDFDIHCRVEHYGPVRRRFCMSNFMRELEGKNGAAATRAMQGRGSLGVGQLYALEARQLQDLMNAEMQRLATEDEQFQEAIAEFSQAQLALTLARGTTTLSRQVTAASGSLPYSAELMFEIIIGVQPFRHQLSRRTFTIADVLGEISKLAVECAEGRQRIAYESDVDWTLPNGWRACTLQVDADRETTFRLYEF